MRMQDYEWVEKIFALCLERDGSENFFVRSLLDTSTVKHLKFRSVICISSCLFYVELVKLHIGRIFLKFLRQFMHS